MPDNTTSPEFVDTSTPDFLNEGAEGGAEGGNDGAVDFDIMERFQGIDMGAYRKAIETDGGEGGEGAEGGAEKGAEGGGAAAAEGGEGGEGDEPDYRQSYVDWAKRQGSTVDITKLPENFGKAEMEQEVALHYASKVVKDPLVLELARSGMTMEDYQKQMAPIKQLLDLKPKDLFAHREANKALQLEVKVGRIKADDAEAKTKFYNEATAEALRKVESLDDSAMEAVVADDRAHLKNTLDELPAKVREQQVALRNAENERLRKEYDTEQQEMLGQVKQAVAKGENYGIPFKSQAERTEFLEYFDKQTKFGDITVKGADGKDTVVQDFPFLKSLEDPKVMTKVLRIMQLLEKGTFTDMKNQVRKSAVEDLDLEPVTTPSRTSKGGDPNGKWADTSTPAYLRGGA